MAEVEPTTRTSQVLGPCILHRGAAVEPRLKRGRIQVPADEDEPAAARFTRLPRPLQLAFEQHVHGDFCVIDDACAHGPGSLSEGYIDGETVECDFHNGVFNIRTGEVVAPPCMVPVKTYRTLVDADGLVSIEV